MTDCLVIGFYDSDFATFVEMVKSMGTDSGAFKDLSLDYVNLPHLEKEKLKSKLLDGDILTIAITTTLYVSVHPILELIQFIRQYNTAAKIVVGGPYVYNLPKLMNPLALQQLFKYMEADIYVISNEGESTLVNI